MCYYVMSFENEVLWISHCRLAAEEMQQFIEYSCRGNLACYVVSQRRM